MNREILFRGRDTDGKWYNGSLIIDYDGNYNIWTPYEFPEPLTGDKIYGDLTIVDKETVGQYTGLKDKNGKMIFEGDLIRISENSIPIIVTFEDYQWLCLRKDIWPYYRHRFDNTLNKYEVVGNIYDNPELLGVGIENFREDDEEDPDDDNPWSDKYIERGR